MNHNNQQPGSADLDLDKLEALARAATPGEWKALRHGVVVAGPLRHYVNGSAQAQIAAFSVTFHEQAPDDEPERQQANTEFCAAANPAVVLQLAALARSAAPAVEQSAEKVEGDLTTMKCPTCEGNGNIDDGHKPRGCDDCDGQGRIIVSRADLDTHIAASRRTTGGDEIINAAPGHANDFLNAALDHIDGSRSTTARRCISAALRLLAAPVSAGQAVQVAKFDEAKLMELVRDFAAVVYGQKRTTEDVGGKLVEYVKSLAAPVSPPDGAMPEPTMLWNFDDPEDGTHGESPQDFAENYVCNSGMRGEHLVDVLCAYRGGKRTMRITASDEARVSWTWAEALPEQMAAPERSDTPAARDVLAERRRQVEQEGWTPEHDDKYQACELARAAATYAVCSHVDQLKLVGQWVWPWNPEWFKRTTYRRDLVKGGALLLAEIERLDRDRARIDGAKQGDQLAENAQAWGDEQGAQGGKA